VSAEDPIARALPEVAADLEGQAHEDGSLARLRERDLNLAVRRTLGRRLDASVVETVVPVTGWPALGRSTTDTVVETEPGSRVPQLVAELKWIRPDGAYKIYEAMWDLFKMALQTRNPSVRGAYLITGAPAPAWQRDPCADLFSDGLHQVDELCRRRSSTRTRWLIWDWMLEGGGDRAPDVVPSPIRTIALPTVPVTAGPHEWELRAVRVEVPPDATDIPFAAGWPRGDRPTEAERPPR
jgi:hypothetical protein